MAKQRKSNGSSNGHKNGNGWVTRTTTAEEVARAINGRANGHSATVKNGAVVITENLRGVSTPPMLMASVPGANLTWLIRMESDPTREFVVYAHDNVTAIRRFERTFPKEKITHIAASVTGEDLIIGAGGA